jgi:two-component system response regulator AtoC
MIERVLIIDDDAALTRSLQLQLRSKGIHATVAGTAGEGLVAVEQQPELVLLDINLPDDSGLSVLGKLVDQDPGLPIVMVTARQDMAATIKAMKAGAFDYIRKPFDVDDILLVIEKLNQRGVRGAQEVAGANEIGPPREIVGSDRQILEVLKQVGLLSRSRVSVLIQGESGTGKELVARALHEASCPSEPFQAINCSAVVPTLLESELFGHEKGAFTGADRQKLGKLELAGAGTLFFDEIGDMDIDLQAKLLRVLQEREFERVGGATSQPFEARVVCATHQDLKAMVAERKFREDLLYRIAVSEIVVPPLRDRPGDIEALVRHFLARLSTELHKQVTMIDSGAIQALRSYSWPGNVRELENVLTRAVALSRGTTLLLDDVSLSPPAATGPQPEGETVTTLADAEKAHVRRMLDRSGWNITQTARVLNISPTTLRKKISDYGLRQQ